MFFSIGWSPKSFKVTVVVTLCQVDFWFCIHFDYKLKRLFFFFFLKGHDEPEERFVLMIYKVSGNGSIDSLQSNITITIAKHGFPNGVFKFDNTATLTFTEPDSGVSTKHFRVVRDEGRQGTVNVSIVPIGPVI